MNTSLDLSKKSFAIYGLGATGQSVVNYFNKSGFRNYVVWDDNKKLKNSWGLTKSKEKIFSEAIEFVDFIVISPGINIKKTKLKKILLENKEKFITDLDIFYLLNPQTKSIVVTGTNGKSTTCKIIEHVLKKNKIKARLAGNIGSPILSINLKKNTFIVIEASSFQLAYSKFIKPDYALLLNISNDHLDWHGTMNNYINSKLKIFSLQKKDDYAFINNKKLLKKIKKNKYLGKIQLLSSKKYRKIKYKIQNDYLNSETNINNMTFVYSLSKILKIKENAFVKSLESFKGLSHRHEIFYRKSNKIFINDSKATSFESTKFALKHNKNIYWIVGGLPKKGDRIQLKGLKKNISKTYIIGKNMKNFSKYLKGKVSIKLCKTLGYAVTSILKDIRNINKEKITILFSPASASFDQFKNFEERGKTFKKLVKNSVDKYF